MFQDDKCGIIWGRLAPMDEFGHFDGKRFVFDDKRYDVEQEAASDAGANVDHMLAYGVWGARAGGRAVRLGHRSSQEIQRGPGTAPGT